MPINAVANSIHTNTNNSKKNTGTTSTTGSSFNRKLSKAEIEAEKKKQAELEAQRKKEEELEKNKKTEREKTPEELELDRQRKRNNGLTDDEVKKGYTIDPLTGKKYIPKEETIEQMRARQEAMKKEMNKRKNPYSKDTFLQLLVTQMKHQDPMEPMDNKDMLAQMAQFSTVEQLSNLNQSFSKFTKGFSVEKADGSTENLLLEQLKRLNDNMEKITDNFGFKEEKDKEGKTRLSKGKFFETQESQFMQLLNRMDSLEKEIKKLAK